MKQELKTELSIEDRMLLLEQQQRQFMVMMQNRFARLQKSVLDDFDLSLEYSRANLSSRCPLATRQDLDRKWAARQQRRAEERTDPEQHDFDNSEEPTQP
jgi:hypothetical protein